MKKGGIIFIIFIIVNSLYGDWRRVWGEVYNRNNYSCIISSLVWYKGKSEYNLYKYEYKNGNIYMGYIDGAHKGAEVWYYADKNKVRAHRGGILKKIILTLSPEDKRLKNKRGRGVLQTDCASYMSLLDTLEMEVKERKDTVIIVGKALPNNEDIRRVKYVFECLKGKWYLSGFYAWDEKGPAYRMGFEYKVE